eukprot:ANDGO_00746.mRNA.1 hypothetical protein
MFVSLAEQLRVVQVRHAALQLDLSTLDHRLPCEGSITKQGHKVKNWKQRVAHLDVDHFWYATAVGQPPIRVVPVASISCIAPYDRHSNEDLKLNLQNQNEDLALYLETQGNDKWSLLFVVDSEAERQKWTTALSDAKRRPLLVVDVSRVRDEMTAVEQRMLEADQT